MSNFVTAEDYQGALDYFGFKGKYDPNNKLFEGGRDPGVTDPVSGEIFYNETAFDGGFDKLSLVSDHEQWHSKRVTTGAYKSSGNSVSTEEYLDYLRNYKRQGFYRNHKMSINLPLTNTEQRRN